MRIKIVVPLKRKKIFVLRKIFWETVLRSKISLWNKTVLKYPLKKSFFSSRLFCVMIKVSKRLLCGEAEMRILNKSYLMLEMNLAPPWFKDEGSGLISVTTFKETIEQVCH